MIIVDLPGGLGNQLFAYFCALFLKLKVSTSVVIQMGTVATHHLEDPYHLDSISLTLDKVNSRKILRDKLFFLFHYPEYNRFLKAIDYPGKKKLHRHFPPGYDGIEEVTDWLRNYSFGVKPVRVSGYFGDFSFYDSLPEHLQRLNISEGSEVFLKYREVIKGDATLGVHFRLGDYLSHSMNVGVISDSYYQECLNLAIDTNRFSRICFFTNDAAEVENRISRLDISLPYSILSPQDFVNPVEHLKLMSYCTGLIASNSTFSFWAAKLSSPDSLIYIPEKWRKDGTGGIRSIPKSWIVHPNAWSD